MQLLLLIFITIILSAMAYYFSNNIQVTGGYDFSKHDESHYSGCEEMFGAIVVSDDKVLIVKDATSENSGFPKGHRLDNETPEAAAIREVKLLTNINITENDFVYDADGPITFKIEFPWQYTQKRLDQMINDAKNGIRPQWHNTKPLVKCIILYLAKINNTELELPELPLGTSVEWVTWKEAERVLEKSRHLPALINANNIIKTGGNDYQFEPVTRSNVKELKKIEVAEHQQHWVSNIMDALAQASFTKNWNGRVLYHNNKIVGFGSYGESYPDSDTPNNTIKILKVMIDKNYQGKGHGKMLVKFLLDDIKLFLAHSDYPKCAYLGVNLDNIPAINLYKKSGFEIIDESKEHNGMLLKYTFE